MKFGIFHAVFQNFGFFINAPPEIYESKIKKLHTFYQELSTLDQFSTE